MNYNTVGKKLGSWTQKDLSNYLEGILDQKKLTRLESDIETLYEQEVKN